MRFIGMLLSLLILALLAYYLITGSLSSSPNATVNKAAQEAGVPGGSFKSGEDVKKRVEGMLQKSAEEQKKAIDEATR